MLAPTEQLKLMTIRRTMEQPVISDALHREVLEVHQEQFNVCSFLFLFFFFHSLIRLCNSMLCFFF